MEYFAKFLLVYKMLTEITKFEDDYRSWFSEDTDTLDTFMALRTKLIDRLNSMEESQ